MTDRSNPSAEPARLGRVALVGYGEVGRILAEDLRARGVEVAACDVKLAAGGDAAQAAPLREHAAALGVALHAGHTQAVEGAGLVVSAVTASQTLAAATACAGALAHGAYYVDFNSASPGAKQQAAAAVAAGGGGRYVEAAVMTSVPPYRIRVPMLLGGPDAAAVQPLLASLGFAARVADVRLGVASATKMCRSVMIKGLEALVIESYTTARRYGVEDAVIASLQETFPGIDWERQGAYFFQRVIEHGRRRSEEMHEVARTVAEAGVDPLLATAAAQRQGAVADLAAAGVFGRRGDAGYAKSADWRVEADRLLKHADRDG